MVELVGEPELYEDDEETIGVSLRFASMPESGTVAIGLQRGGIEEIARGLAILPGPSVHFNLDKSDFEVGVDITVAVKIDGFSTPEAPNWANMDWSWAGELRACMKNGKLQLARIA